MVWLYTLTVYGNKMFTFTDCCRVASAGLVSPVSEDVKYCLRPMMFSSELHVYKKLTGLTNNFDNAPYNHGITKGLLLFKFS